MSMPAIKEKMVQADGIRLHVTETGNPEGPVLVWLHGAGPGASGMDNFSANIDSFPGFRNLVFDFPRYGKSDKPAVKEPLFSYNARQVIAALDTLGVKKATMIGNSMGGGTALRMAVLRPELIERLVLMGSAGAIPHGEALTPTLLMMIDALKNGATREKIRAIAVNMVYDPSLIKDELIERRYANAIDPETVASAKDTLLAPESVADDLHKITAPTLVIWGREDPVLPLRWAKDLTEKLPNAETRIVPHCGHWVQLEQPEWFNRMLADFLTH